MLNILGLLAQYSFFNQRLSLLLYQNIIQQIQKKIYELFYLIHVYLL